MHRKLETKRQQTESRDPMNKLPNQIDWFEHRLYLSGFVFILICEWWWWLNGMDNHWIHAAISNNYVPVLVVVMAVVFVIAKVESCICQSNRLENLMTISIVIHTKIWEHFELHTHTNTQVANWFQIICWMKKWHPKWIAHFDRINLRTERERERNGKPTHAKVCFKNMRVRVWTPSTQRIHVYGSFFSTKSFGYSKHANVHFKR